MKKVIFGLILTISALFLTGCGSQSAWNGVYTNEEKEKFLLDNNIAIFDVIKECEIDGSKDSSIKNVKVNDINKILKETKIEYIFTTGKKAFSYYNLYLKDKTKKEAIYLPSPSSANASFNLNDLIKEYQIILDLNR